MINLILPHRCTIRRGTTVYENGSPVTVYKDVATNVPCLFVRREFEKYQMDASTTTAARSNGTFYCEPDTDIKAGDTVSISGLGSFKIGTQGGLEYDFWGQQHHFEFPVAMTAAA